MTWGEPIGLTPGDARYPARLRERLGANAPGQLSALGNLDLLAQLKTALFSSALPSAFLRGHSLSRGSCVSRFQLRNLVSMMKRARSGFAR